MADLVLMPKLGFDMAEGTLIRWTKKDCLLYTSPSPRD